MARWVYREDGTGRIKPVLIRGGVVKCDETMLPFNEQMLKSYYALECRDGCRFRPDYNYHTANQIKRAWQQ